MQPASRPINIEELYRDVRKKWVSIYPAYFDKTKTLTEGRRVSESLCIDHPTSQQVIKALNILMIRCIFENDKAYPKDWMTRGRLKVEVKNKDTNTPVYSYIKTKEQLLREIGKKLVLLRKK